MTGTPYSIFYTTRPLRVAFLLDPDRTSPELWDSFFTYNTKKWGGRHNVVVFTDGKTIRESWWNLLRVTDPDVIKSLVPVEEELDHRIAESLSPYSLETSNDRAQEPDEYRVHLEDHPISILPTVEALREIARPWMDAAEFVHFEMEPNTDAGVRRFLLRNFGHLVLTVHVREALENTRSRVFHVLDYQSVAGVFGELAGIHHPVVYPIQLSALPNTEPEVEYKVRGEAFTIVLGDSSLDLAYHWNRCRFLTLWKRTRIMGIWLPAELMADHRFLEALKPWIKRTADPGGSGQGEVEVVSASVPAIDLKATADRLMEGTFLRHRTRLIQDPDLLSLNRRPLLIGPPPGAIHHRATADEEYVVVREPSVHPSELAGEHYMVDFYIEYRPDQYPGIVGRTLWWQLPRRNLLVQVILNGSTRIVSEGIPSLRMSRGSPAVRIRIPLDSSVFQIVLLEQQGVRPPKRAGAGLPKKSFFSVQRSDKGKYLHGIVELLGGLSPAWSILESRYWRRMFDRLAGARVERTEARLVEVCNKLRKRNVRFSWSDFGSDDEGLQWLARLVLKLAREEGTATLELPFEVFHDELLSEYQEFNTRQPDGQRFSFSKAIVEELLAQLTEVGALQMGVVERCPKCGASSWYHVDDLRQVVTCRGCTATFGLYPERTWSYRLNSLLTIGVSSQDVVPVLLVLGNLLLSARTSFIWRPSVELLEEGDVKPAAEVDILCIQDGKLIIGEAKHSHELFRASDFEQMSWIAERVRADVVLFSSLDLSPSRPVREYLAGARRRLAPLGIEVAWYQLPKYVFEASPIR